MGRTRDEEFWNHVEKLADGSLKCKFCHKVLSGKPSISRIKSHLSGLRGRGVQICDRVEVNVREEARKAIEGPNKRCRTIPSSSNNEASNPSSTQPINQVGIELPPFEVHTIGREVRGGPTSFDHAGVENFTANNVEESMQLFEPRGEELLTKELVGVKIQAQLEQIFRWSTDDRVSRIGIYGMGGVGKTELAQHLYNELLKTPNSFHHLYWVTVSPDFSIHMLQSEIANIMNVDFSRVTNEPQRAAKLSTAVNKSEKFVLFLDDVWDYIPLNKVGIPITNGCKLILTTRSLDVCLKMDCQKNFEVNPLSEEEGWRFFMKELGVNSTLPKEVEEIARSITSKCDGLPLGIEIMARNMKGVNDIHEWRYALDKFEGAISRQDNLELFGKLKLSYDYLDNSALQQCFLYSAFLLREYGVEKEELIDYLIDEEVIKGESRQAEFDEGHTILNRLAKACLLDVYVDENENDKECVKMHKLIRNMGIQIMGKNGRVMVKTDAKLKEIPDCGKWIECLEKVSLANNLIEEIPSGLSPRCPILLTLLLRGNWKLRRIADSFFEQLNGLKVLDLSLTVIEELPDSISDLVNLNVLLLSGCWNLRYVPSLANLKKLKKLDLYLCNSVENVPQGIKQLSNLRYLDFRDTRIKELPVCILPQLSHMQVLMLGIAKVKVEELVSLRKLETLNCRFYDVGGFNTFTSTATFNLNNYLLLVGEHTEYFSNVIFEIGNDERRLVFDDCSGIECLFSLSSNASIFQSLEKIEISNLKNLSFLFSREENATPSRLPFSPPYSIFCQLKYFHIWQCPKLKKLFPTALLSNLQNLESLKVKDCEEMEEMIAMEGEQESHDSNCSIQLTLPKLKSFELSRLPKLKSISSRNIICDSLEYITVNDCKMLKRIPLSLVVMDNENPLFALPSLERIFVSPREWWESVELVHPKAKDILSHLLDFP